MATVEGGQRIFKTAIDAFGGLDILVNNAGILRDKTLYNMEESDWDAVIAVHLKGHYTCTRPFVRYIKDAGRMDCRIINFSSVSGLFGNFGQANYGAAKAGIAGFSRVLAKELAKFRCTVNTISPGAAVVAAGLFGCSGAGVGRATTRSFGTADACDDAVVEACGGCDGTIAVVMGESRCAATNAAFKAMLWMLPPARFSRASRSTSSASSAR